MEKFGHLAEQERIGFLELTGSERLFALDGQHRVSGIKRALQNDGDASADILTVLFVSHQNTHAGIQRTRRLFIDLNKRVVPVGLKDIIILDEIDLPAILARRLVDGHEWFSRGQVDIERFTSTIPATSDALFSIATLYSVIRRLLPNALAETTEERKEVQEAISTRLSENRIDYYVNRTLKFFCGIAAMNEQLHQYLEEGPDSGIAQLARDPNVRNVLFRPAGQAAIANAVATIAKSRGLDFALEVARHFPTDMALPPFEGTIWDKERKMMIAKGASLAGRLLTYMSGLETEKPTRLLSSYRLALGQESAELPQKFVIS